MKNFETEIKKAGKEIKKIGKGAKDLLEKNPKKSIAVAASIGALLGGLVTSLVGGKKKKRK